jgi:hypothetical protein
VEILTPNLLAATFTKTAIREVSLKLCVNTRELRSAIPLPCALGEQAHDPPQYQRRPICAQRPLSLDLDGGLDQTPGFRSLRSSQDRGR